MEERIDFELFKSYICHQVKRLGDIQFIMQTLEDNTIRKYFQMNQYKESLYLLAMVDYLSRENNVPLCTEYDDIRHTKLKHVLFPRDILLTDMAMQNNKAKEKALKDAIPEFMRFNIVESEIRNVV